MIWNGKEYPCKIEHNYVWCYFAKPNEKEAWRFMGALHHFVNNPDYKLISIGAT
jgi:hypothetical protein